MQEKVKYKYLYLFVLIKFNSFCTFGENTGWKRNVSKRMRQSGKPYITTSGKFRESQSPANIRAHNKCRFKCLENVPEQKRIDMQ